MVNKESFIADILSSSLSDDDKNKVVDLVNKNKIDWIPVKSGNLPASSNKVMVTELYHNPYFNKDFLVIVHDCYYYRASEENGITEDGFYFYKGGRWNKVEIVKAWMYQIDFESYKGE